MRFHVVRVMSSRLPAKAGPAVHWQAWPLDLDAAGIGLWRLGPKALCGRTDMVRTDLDPLQCETCAITACLMTNAAEVFDRYRARLLAERYTRETA